MPITGSNARVHSHSYLCAFCLLLPLGTVAVNNDDGSNWVITWLLVCVNYAIWLVLSSSCHFLTDNSLQSARNPCCGRETARRRWKIWYLSKSTAAVRGSPCDSTANVTWCMKCKVRCCYATYSCPFVSWSMTLRYQGHTDWVTLKLITVNTDVHDCVLFTKFIFLAFCQVVQ